MNPIENTPLTSYHPQEKEVGKIERLLEASESEKQELQNALDEAKKLIENTQKVRVTDDT